MKMISLVKKSEELGPITKGPSDVTSGPTLYISHDEPIEFPKSGTAVVKFKKIASSEFERDGETRYTCELEITDIAVTKGDKKSGGEVLDELKAKKEKEY